eukprot:350857-Chlamydomonas_euryale.AAC.1
MPCLCAAHRATYHSLCMHALHVAPHACIETVCPAVWRFLACAELCGSCRAVGASGDAVGHAGAPVHVSHMSAATAQQLLAPAHTCSCPDDSPGVGVIVVRRLEEVQHLATLVRCAQPRGLMCLVGRGDRSDHGFRSHERVQRRQQRLLLRAEGRNGIARHRLRHKAGEIH